MRTWYQYPIPWSCTQWWGITEYAFLPGHGPWVKPPGPPKHPLRNRLDYVFLVTSKNCFILFINLPQILCRHDRQNGDRVMSPRQRKGHPIFGLDYVFKVPLETKWKLLRRS